MPTNLYGPNDNYSLQTSHVLPALIRKFHEAKLNNEPSVVMWGTGQPRREFLHADDLADACYFLMQHYNEAGFVNIGTGEDITIKDLALLIKNVVGYAGNIEHDLSKPDGTPRKLMDVQKLNTLGWKAQTALREGIEKVYREFAQLHAVGL
jgi:GDP-L-fucose synthase